MRSRREIMALVGTAVVAVLVLIGFIFFDLPSADGPMAPKEQETQTDAPEDVDTTPPSATGDITDP